MSHLLLSDSAEPGWSLAVDFFNQIAGGAAVGLAAGFALVWLINRLDLASGLYPILAMAWALFTFSGAQALGASGFLAVYLAGLIVGNRRHRAAQLINRFHDGLAWLAQMVMFVMLGLLVTPSDLLPTLVASVLIAAFLVMLGRPVAVVLCLLPFRFAWNEQAFIAWVGLRGAVAIFLGSIPVLAGVEHASIYFQVAFAVVIVSLVVQGWTIAQAARLLEVELPPMPRTAPRIDVDLPASERDLLIYSVGPGSRIARRGLRRLLQLENTSLVGAVRDGRLLRPRELDRLDPGDSVLVIAPSGQASGARRAVRGTIERGRRDDLRRVHVRWRPAARQAGGVLRSDRVRGGAAGPSGGHRARAPRPHAAAWRPDPPGQCRVDRARGPG